MKISKVGVVIALLAASVGLRAQSSSPAVPKEPGLYLYQAGQMVRVEGQVVSFARTGGLLTSALTYGIKSRKTNVQILGSSARVTAGAGDPTFYFREATDNEAAGGGVADLVLLRMQVRGKRRQVEIGAAGYGRASRGVSINSQVMFDRTEIGQAVYRLNTDDLRPGQYCFYLFRGNELPAIMYPFGSEQTHSEMRFAAILIGLHLALQLSDPLQHVRLGTALCIAVGYWVSTRGAAGVAG